MSEMIDRVAKAMAEDGRLDDGECGVETTEDGWMRLARVAIAAMREPTPEMIYAAGSSFSRTEALWLWRVMNDEALK